MSNATAQLDRAPDVAGEIVGFRAWYISGRSRRIRLKSIYSDDLWPTDDWLRASCGQAHHLPPSEGCACGIYAGRDVEHLVELGYNDGGDMDSEIVAIGEVGFAGKVIVGEKGWRAEKARPLRLLVSYQDWQLVEPLSLAYGVPVGLANILNPRR